MFWRYDRLVDLRGAVDKSGFGGCGEGGGGGGLRFLAGGGSFSCLTRDWMCFMTSLRWLSTLHKTQTKPSHTSHSHSCSHSWTPQTLSLFSQNFLVTSLTSNTTRAQSSWAHPKSTIFTLCRITAKVQARTCSGEKMATCCSKLTPPDRRRRTLHLVLWIEKTA